MWSLYRTLLTRFLLGKMSYLKSGWISLYSKNFTRKIVLYHIKWSTVTVPVDRLVTKHARIPVVSGATFWEDIREVFPAKKESSHDQRLLIDPSNLPKCLKMTKENRIRKNSFPLPFELLIMLWAWLKPTNCNQAFRYSPHSSIWISQLPSSQAFLGLEKPYIRKDSQQD